MSIKKIGKTQRITDMSRVIIENVLVVTGQKTGANKIIEDALSKEYPLFAEMFKKSQRNKE